MTVASIASTVTAGTLLAANSGREGAAIRNTDANILYVLLDGSVVSATNHTIALNTGDYYEVPPSYRGVVKGVWALAGSGAALVTTWSGAE